MISACVWRKVVSQRAPNVGILRLAHLHANVGITHATINSQLLELVSAVLLHGFENRLGLEASSFKGRTCDMSTLSVLRQADYQNC